MHPASSEAADRVAILLGNVKWSKSDFQFGFGEALRKAHHEIYAIAQAPPQASAQGPRALAAGLVSLDNVCYMALCIQLQALFHWMMF